MFPTCQAGLTKKDFQNNALDVDQLELLQFVGPGVSNSGGGRIGPQHHGLIPLRLNPKQEPTALRIKREVENVHWAGVENSVALQTVMLGLPGPVSLS